MKKNTLLALIAFTSLLSWSIKAQFVESFEAGIPPTWTVLNEDGGEYTWAASSNASTTFPRTGAANAVIHWEGTAHNDYLITPAISVTAGVTDQFSFWAGINGTFWTEAYEVSLSTTGTAASDFTVLLDAGTVTTNAVLGDYTKLAYNLSAYAGQTVYIAIVAVDTDRFYLYVDDAVSDALPSCPAPSDGVSVVTSTTTATVSWTSGGAANAEVVVQTAGTGIPALADNTGDTATGNTFLATDLSPTTAYEFYVRDECVDGTDLSEWAGPYLFDTTTVPGCSTPVNPADGSIDVPVGDITFEWTAPTTGDPATSYDMYYGLTPDDVNILVGNFEETSALITLTGYDFLFYWRIVPINAGGEAVGCEGTVWSFTTESEPLPPINDECDGAIDLIPAVDFATGAITTTNAGATYEDAILPSCQADVDASVWYTIVVPASGTITIETQAADGLTLTDTVIEAYTGTCGGVLTPVGCNDDAEGGTDFFSILSLSGLTPGETIYVGVYRYGSSGILAGAFQIAAYDASLATNTFNSATFAAYPNPVKDVLNLTYDKNISNVAVFNLLGQQILTKSVNATDSQVDMSNLTSGTYFVKVTADDEVQTIKVIKQ
jgi:hypothetical protein